MSDDDQFEIVLETASEVAPPERPEPVQDRALVTAATGNPAAAAVGVYVYAGALQGIDDHARSSPSAEVGGVLLGRIYRGGSRTWVDITGFLPARMADEGRMHLTFTHETWAEINSQKDAQYPDEQIVGWYHTHPGLTVFLSDMDRFIHRSFFAGSSLVALVCDPLSNRRSFFEWRGESLAESPGYMLYAERDKRQALTQLERRLKTQAPPTRAAGAVATPQPVNVRVEFREPAVNLYHLVPPGARRGLGMADEQTAPRVSIKNLIIVGLLGLSVYLWAFPRQGHLQMARALERAEFFDEAASEYRKHLALHPQDLKALASYIAVASKGGRVPSTWQVDQGYYKLLELADPTENAKRGQNVDAAVRTIQEALRYHPPSQALAVCLRSYFGEGTPPDEAQYASVKVHLPDTIAAQIRLNMAEAAADGADDDGEGAGAEDEAGAEDAADTPRPSGDTGGKAVPNQPQKRDEDAPEASSTRPEDKPEKRDEPKDKKVE